MRQIHYVATDNSLNASATEFLALANRASNTTNATQELRRCIAPSNGQIMMMRVKLASAPTGKSNGYTFTIRKNNTDTNLTVTIMDNDTEGENLNDVVDYTSGDELNLKITPIGTPTSGKAYVTFVWEDKEDWGRHAVSYFSHDDTARASLLAESNKALGGDYWQTMVIFGGLQNKMYTPLPLEINKYYVKTSTAPGSGKSYTIRLLQTSSLKHQVVIQDTDDTGEDTTSISYPVNTSIYQNMQASGSPPSPYIITSWRYKCDEPYNQIAMGYENKGISASGTYYNYIQGTGNSWASIASGRELVMDACTIGNLYIRTSQAPTPGTWTFTLYKNGQPTSLEVELSGSDKTGSNTTEFIEYGAGDTATLGVVAQGGTPTKFETTYSMSVRSNIIPQAGMQMTGMGI